MKFQPLKTVTLSLSLFMIGINTYGQKSIPLKDFFKNLPVTKSFLILIETTLCTMEYFCG